MRTPAQKRIDTASRAAAEETVTLLRAASYAMKQAATSYNHLRDTMTRGKALPSGAFAHPSGFAEMATGSRHLNHYAPGCDTHALDSLRASVEAVLDDLDAADKADASPPGDA